jgi:TctA family transporter
VGTLIQRLRRNSVIGIIPGLGPTLGAFLGYDLAWRTSKKRGKFGKGSIEGIAGAESGNNAVSGANLIPLLGLGVPGDVEAAILVGAFLIHGLTPGPLIFQEAPDVVYSTMGACLFYLFCLFWLFPANIEDPKGFRVSALLYPDSLLILASICCLLLGIFQFWRRRNCGLSQVPLVTKRRVATYICGMALYLAGLE